MIGNGNIRLIALVVALGMGVVVTADAQGRPQMRKHTATESNALQLVSANQSLSSSRVSISENGRTRTIRSNGIPDHAVGRFPNRGNPNPIEAQNYTFKVSVDPSVGSPREMRRGGLFGVAVNGIPFDPGAAEFWQGDRNIGWQYEALGGAVRLGLDENYGHVQPNGAYHYHGLPVGLMQDLGWSSRAESPLIGYAADGFPIYAISTLVDGQVQKMESSYQLKAGNRPGGSEPSGDHDGTFVQDYTYVAGSGDLDRCNGTFVTTADYPDGTYAYFLTEAFPVIPRCLVGDADSSFTKRRR